MWDNDTFYAFLMFVGSFDSQFLHFVNLITTTRQSTLKVHSYYDYVAI